MTTTLQKLTKKKTFECFACEEKFKTTDVQEQVTSNWIRLKANCPTCNSSCVVSGL